VPNFDIIPSSDRTPPQSEPVKSKIALITGASSGIGEATARKLAQMKMSVILVARRLAKLETIATSIHLAGGQAVVIPADLTLEAERFRVFNQVVTKFGGADVVVNNAGFGWYGFGNEMPWSLAREMIGLNVTAVVHFTLLFLQKMKEQGSGHIINIGSISGEIPSQGIALYGATKSFLNNFSTALYRELQNTTVKVSVIRAGPVQTEFCQAAVEKPNGFNVPTEKMGVSAEVIADKVWKLIQHPRRVIYVPSILAVTPWIEACFGGIIDRLGPLLLRQTQRK
jgi:short-subunit dehydrogenase